jgi:hypothetical protein
MTIPMEEAQMDVDMEMQEVAEQEVEDEEDMVIAEITTTARLQMEATMYHPQISTKEKRQI